jgi:hypothetical protein
MNVLRSIRSCRWAAPDNGRLGRMCGFSGDRTRWQYGSCKLRERRRPNDLLAWRRGEAVVGGVDVIDSELIAESDVLRSALSFPDRRET